MMEAPKRARSPSELAVKVGGSIDESHAECPVCMEFFGEHIYQCSEGHLVCAACKEKLPESRCPSCRQPVGSVRNRAMEQLIGEMNLPCTHKELGCKFAGPHSSRRTHEKSCKFSPIRCPFATKCRCEFAAGRLADHLRNEHKKEVTRLQQGVATVRNHAWPMAKEDVAKRQWVGLFEVPGGRVLAIHTIVELSRLAQYAFVLGGSGSNGDTADFKVELTTDLDDDQTAVFRVKPMVITRNRIDSKAFIDCISKEEHPEAPCYTVRRPNKRAEAVFGVAEDPDAQELHELQVTLL